MDNRLKALISEFPRFKIDGMLVNADVNVRYLTRFPASESWLLVTRKKAVYITDFRYMLEARKGLSGVRLKQYTQSLYQTTFELCKEFRVKRLGFDEQHFSVACLKKIKGFCPRRTKLVAANNIVENFREIKDAQELGHIRAALKLQFKALRYLKKVIKPGLTEKAVLEKLERFVKGHGAVFSFSPIIASGPNSCFPHAHVTDRVIRNNEPVLVDFGVEQNGYKSDLTRIFFLGRIAPQVQKVFTAVREAQLKAIAMIKPGVTVADIDHEARKYLRKFGLAKYFGHSLGHGVGLEIHECPRVSCKSTALLEAGMVVTVEPGVYIPHQFGIRVEDMVLVTPQGCEVLSADNDQ